jgi:hypothetical protein
MSISSEQSTVLPLNTSGKPPEVFSPPGITDLNSLTDGRNEGAYSTAYRWGAWLQIIVELIYLVALLLSGLVGLVLLAKYAVFRENNSGFVFGLLGPADRSRMLQLYVTIALSGVCGGCSSALKWLYHSIAKQRWHQDRIIWRLVVPPLSGTLAVFTAMMIISGLVPFLAKSWLTNLTAGAAFGFFVGLFSDNLLAALEKVAFNLFGTMNDRFQKRSDQGDAESK